MTNEAKSTEYWLSLHELMIQFHEALEEYDHNSLLELTTKWVEILCGVPLPKEQLREEAQTVNLTTPLTEREIQVVEQLVSGKSNKELASALVLAEHTVKVHLRNIYEKLGLRRREQLVAFALSSGLVFLDESGQPKRASGVVAARRNSTHRSWITRQ